MELWGQPQFSTVVDFLGGPHIGADGDWIFDFGVHLDSSWGGTYGGALGAAVLQVARAAVPGRTPRSLHLQMARQVGTGGVRATADIVNAGRMVTTVEVRLFDGRGKLAVIGLVTMIDATTLDRTLDYTTTDPLEFRRVPLDANMHATTPVVATLQMPTAMEVWEVTNLPPSVSGEGVCASPAITPWRELDATGPELSCVVGDLCNGGAMMSGLPDDVLVAFPNSDLSMRFVTETATDHAVGVGTLVAVHEGAAIVDIRVQAQAQQLGRGLTTSLLIPLPPAQAPAARWHKAEQLT